jgi:D-arginine dehydrogenase
MSGASLAAELAPQMSVLLIEAEAHPGYHATGRSAAFWSETYGGPHVQPLTSASGPWLNQPPADFGGESFLTTRGEINLGRAEDQAKLERFQSKFAARGFALDWMDRADIDARCDFLTSDWDRGVGVPSCADIDVAALHQAYLRAAKQRGVDLWCNAGLERAERNGAGWLLETRAGQVRATVIVNAAGAWADPVAALAGVKPLGITPYRRTVVQLRLDRDVPRDLPLIIDVNGSFYFKSDGAGGIWLSPHDEIPSPPTDAAPEELDVAIAIDRFETASTAKVRKVSHKWAGLRSFAPDRLPVYGFDLQQPGFFWFAGQGGFGIQTAPAAAKMASALITGSSPDPMVSQIDPAHYAPERFT